MTKKCHLLLAMCSSCDKIAFDVGTLTFKVWKLLNFYCTHNPTKTLWENTIKYTYLECLAVSPLHAFCAFGSGYAHVYPGFRRQEPSWKKKFSIDWLQFVEYNDVSDRQGLLYKTVDGRNPSNQLIWWIFGIQGFIHLMCLAGFLPPTEHHISARPLVISPLFVVGFLGDP